jgi:hypothetical protein
VQLGYVCCVVQNWDGSESRLLIIGFVHMEPTDTPIPYSFFGAKMEPIMCMG